MTQQQPCQGLTEPCAEGRPPRYREGAGYFTRGVESTAKTVDGSQTARPVKLDGRDPSSRMVQGPSLCFLNNSSYTWPIRVIQGAFESSRQALASFMGAPSSLPQPDGSIPLGRSSAWCRFLESAITRATLGQIESSKIRWKAVGIWRRSVSVPMPGSQRIVRYRHRRCAPILHLFRHNSSCRPRLHPIQVPEGS